jgi:hypothetical protein
VADAAVHKPASGEHLACDCGPSKIASDCAGPPLAGRANLYKHFLAHCGAETCDFGRRTFIPVWVPQDTTVRTANHADCGRIERAPNHTLSPDARGTLGGQMLDPGSMLLTFS